MNGRGRNCHFPTHALRFAIVLGSLLTPSLLLAPSGLAQASMAGHAMGTLDETPPDKYAAPEKLTGIGNVHIKITATPEAQMWFDQGLNLLHDFWDYESVRAFQQSVRVDPQCAMCYWGLYQALTFRRSSGKDFAAEALAKAVSLKDHASKSERLYIEAATASEQAEKQEDKKKDKNGDSKEVQILRKLVKTAPHDTQARIYLAEALIEGYEDDGAPKKGTKKLRDSARCHERRTGKLRREPLLDSCGRSQSSPGAGPAQRGNSRPACAHFRAHGAHARPHLLSHRRLRSRAASLLCLHGGRRTLHAVAARAGR